MLTAGAALVVVLLALGSVLWPAVKSRPLSGVMLVFDPMGQENRVAEVYEPLAAFLAHHSGVPLRLAVVRDVASFRQRAEQGADFIFCPDGAALLLDRARYIPLATGRRAAPRNLRPRSVLVYRRSAGLRDEPWLAVPARTVAGDSLSLCGAGQVLAERSPRQVACAFGPDPFDHGPVLHAARLGGFDYAVVRQWDADRFLDSGLLPSESWAVVPLGEPVPDAVLLAATTLGAADRLATGQALAALGRGNEAEEPLAAALVRGLQNMRLVGFHMLLEPDWAGVVRRFPGFFGLGGGPQAASDSLQGWHQDRE